jgi:septum formation protein
VRKIVLASSSPRRAALFAAIGLKDYEIINPEVDETVVPGFPPEDLVAHWSRKKAEKVMPKCEPSDIIIGADTVVWHGGRILGKPADARQAAEMLRSISGDWHSVYTGVTVSQDGKMKTEIEVTGVLIRSLTQEQIESYVACGESLDKAGAYGIQGRGALLCERLDGDYYNVMGMPLYRLSHLLADYGLDLLVSCDP